MKKFLYINLFFVLINSAYADHPTISLETGSAGPITTSSAVTLPKGKAIFGSQLQFIENDEFTDEQLRQFAARDQDVHSIAALLEFSLNGAYGITDDFTIGFTLPYVERMDVREGEVHGGESEAANIGDPAGIGDLTLFGQYRFLHDIDHGMDAAIIAGLKAPTGETEEINLEHGFFEMEQQPGTGSWDGLIGIALSKNWNRLSLSSNLLHTFVTQGERDTELGDIFNYNLGISYRLAQQDSDHEHEHQSHNHGLFDYIDLILELNGDWRQKVTEANEKDLNTGGNTLYLASGVRIGLWHRISAFISAGIPVLDDLNGEQSVPEFRIVAGFNLLLF